LRITPITSYAERGFQSIPERNFLSLPSLLKEREILMNDKEALIDGIRQWKKVYLRGDIDKILSSYAEDGMMMSFDGIIAKGRDNIRKIYNLWQRVGPPKVFNYEILEVEVHGDMAYYSMKWDGVYPESSGDVTMSGTSQAVLKRQTDGGWLIISEIICGDLDSITEINERIGD